VTTALQRRPVAWSPDELRAARDAAEALYVEQHGQVRANEPEVVHAMQVTACLQGLTEETLKGSGTLWQTLRFFCGPPISEENLWTFVGKKFAPKGGPRGVEAETARVLRSGIDEVRFPWVHEARPPTEAELRAAVMSTTVLMAQARHRTRNRGQAARTQESEVKAALEAAGFEHLQVRSLDRLRPGTFCDERTLHNKKCDIPVRLLDGRLLTLECKVSNTPKNSWKRLNQEAVGKSATWREHLHTGVVTGVVLAGVFDLACLVQAQDQGLAIFWQHDLGPLRDFVAVAHGVAV